MRPEQKWSWRYHFDGDSFIWGFVYLGIRLFVDSFIWGFVYLGIRLFVDSFIWGFGDLFHSSPAFEPFYWNLILNAQIPNRRLNQPMVAAIKFHTHYKYPDLAIQITNSTNHQIPK